MSDKSKSSESSFKFEHSNQAIRVTNSTSQKIRVYLAVKTTNNLFSTKANVETYTLVGGASLASFGGDAYEKQLDAQSIEIMPIPKMKPTGRFTQRPTLMLMCEYREISTSGPLIRLEYPLNTEKNSFIVYSQTIKGSKALDAISPETLAIQNGTLESQQLQERNGGSGAGSRKGGVAKQTKTVKTVEKNTNTNTNQAARKSKSTRKSAGAALF